MEIKMTKKETVGDTKYYVWINGECDKCFNTHQEASVYYQAAVLFAKKQMAALYQHETLSSETIS